MDKMWVSNRSESMQNDNWVKLRGKSKNTSPSWICWGRNEQCTDLELERIQPLRTKPIWIDHRMWTGAEIENRGMRKSTRWSLCERDRPWKNMDVLDIPIFDNLNSPKMPNFWCGTLRARNWINRGLICRQSPSCNKVSWPRSSRNICSRDWHRVPFRWFIAMENPWNHSMSSPKIEAPLCYGRRDCSKS